ncbi:hypothetical protein TWF694_005161 [Orbilia ellipsospora]|uniref:Uncharacterized protein n=1 Tax=Orbilia ellipsospora TaxID=2528407 RepID=A0AAV9WWC2_9PEZI
MAPSPNVPISTLSPAQSHQSGTITNHWNDLPSAYIPTSRTATPARTPPASYSPAQQLHASSDPRKSPNLLSRNRTLEVPKSNGYLLNGGGSPGDLSPPMSSASATATEENDQIPAQPQLQRSQTLKPLSTLLPALYNLPTSLSQNERNMLQSRINKSLLPAKAPTVSESQLAFIQALLQEFIVEETIDSKMCREEIVAFMRRESGVAGWAGSVRKVVESVVGR